MLIRYYAVTLTFGLESSRYIKRHVIKSVRNLSEIEQSLAELFKILLIFAHVMSRSDLDL